MIAGVADTHTALWYLYNDPRLSKVAGDFMDRAAVSGNRIAVSSISLAELVYLVEKIGYRREPTRTCGPF